MNPVRRFDGLVAPLRRANVDTDAIIPSREMKRVSKQGLAEGLFAGWRYRDASSRDSNPDFVLNQDAYRNASILVTGANFGCGSSREHAVWALKEYGFRAILAPSFGAIFERNCFNNGVLPLSVTPSDLERILNYTETAPSERVITVGPAAGWLRIPADFAHHIERIKRLGSCSPFLKTVTPSSCAPPLNKACRSMIKTPLHF